MKCLHNNELLFNNSRAQLSTGNISFCESHSVMSDSLWPHALYSPWNSSGQNTGEVSLSVLQGIFPTQGLNPSELHMDYLPAEAPGKPKKYGMLHEFVCHPCAGAMTNFSVLLQFQYSAAKSRANISLDPTKNPINCTCIIIFTVGEPKICLRSSKPYIPFHQIRNNCSLWILSKETFYLSPLV